MGAIFAFLGGLVGAIIIAAIPVVWAMYKKQDNAQAILKVSILVLIVGTVVSLALGFLAGLLSFLGILCTVWSVVTLAATVYIYFCAFTNKQPELFEKIGIK